MRTRIHRTVLLAAAGALTLSACSGASTDDGGGGEEITFIVYSGPEVEFFAPVVNGAEAAAKDHGVKLNVQYADEDNAKQNNLIQLATEKADGIAVSIQDNNAFTDSICAAHDKGVPVVSFNVDASEGRVLDCRMAFVGQNFEETGYLIGKRMIADHDLKEGDEVLAPVEVPEAVYGIERAKGLKQALDEVGAKMNVIGTGFDLAEVQTKLAQYLLGNPETAAVIALGSAPLTVAPAATKEANVDIPIGGFDLTEGIISAIQDGDITATVDQQPYSQGYYAVSQLVLNIRYGLYPSTMDTGGAGLVDETNVDTVAKLVGDVR